MLKSGILGLVLISTLFLLSGCKSNEAPPSTQPAPSSQKNSPPSLPPDSPTESKQASTPAPPPPAEHPSESPVPKPPRPPALKPAPAKPVAPDPILLNPSRATAKAPQQFKVKFETTKGEIILQVNRAWAPNGSDRFYNLVKAGFYNDVAFFRVIDGFMAQFGIHGDPQVNAKWEPARIEDDPVNSSNTRGAVSFATAGPNTRTTQLFINYGDNSMLDSRGFAPFARVITGMNVVDSLYKGYGEGAPRGSGPSQGELQSQGNTYLRSQFPKLDYIKRASIIR